MSTWTCWNDAFAHFSKVADRLGKPIDKGIIEVVVALNLLDVPTCGSCEGHIGWGLPYPWIDIVAERGPKFRLHQLLEHFYQDHHPPFDCVLVFHGYRIQSRGGMFWESYPEARHEEHLLAYQAEMDAFARFLITLLPEAVQVPDHLLPTCVVL